VENMQKVKKIKLILIFMFISAILTGCSSMNSGFDCPNKPGVNCRSLGQVNDMIDSGALDKDVTKDAHTPKFDITKSNIDRENPFRVLRSGEQVIRIWIAPYQDVQNNYHNASTLYTVVNKSNWDVPKEINE
jgi:conjugal transfer pilus assembly protein TraV